MSRSSLHWGQSSQPSPDPVSRTAAPVTTMTIRATSAPTVIARYRPGLMVTRPRLGPITIRVFAA